MRFEMSNANCFNLDQCKTLSSGNYYYYYHYYYTKATVGSICHGDTECGADECCYAKPDFMVVSKRGPPLFLPEPGLATPKPGRLSE